VKPFLESAGDRFLGMRERFGRLPRAAQRASLPVVVLLLGWVDFLTGYEIQFFAVYILAVSFYAYCLGFASSLLCSLLCTASFLVTDLLGGHLYSHPLIPAWNAAIRLATFSFIGFILDRLRRDLERELHLARTDPLTGVPNRKSFYESLERARARALETGGPISVGYLDLDGFKRLNDQCGHDAGDEALKSAAAALRGALRAGDHFARVGGDEFAFFFPDAGSETAGEVARRLTEALRQAARALPVPVDCSVGVVTFAAPREAAAALVRRADELMYRVKRGGGGRFAQESVP